ncbi:hypothetical protein D8674_010479 [Pyrus ussuriensis x Pyrus communis]|uniref:Zinc knuckle CX2CX4HX4C domain-containing protein n=1 Tax=Pyrus ussuriensis x Pyrus communis TaxID=2448454 RepID=A0A5N5FAU9_9ROSA|nr:hypothetical protein D8674_010479 [Pyrus ussuriensis x Pyrus communis]
MLRPPHKEMLCSIFRDEDAIHYLSVNFEDSLDLEERFDDNLHLVVRLLADNEPSEHVMGVVKVLKAKPNIYAINVGEEAVMLWAILEVEDLFETGFHGFLRLRVNFDDRRRLVTCFQIPCQNTGSRLIRLKYEGLRIFCYRCGRLGHPEFTARQKRVNQTSKTTIPVNKDKIIATTKDKSDVAPFVALSTPNADLSEADTLMLELSGSHLPRLNNIPNAGHMWHPNSFGT